MFIQQAVHFFIKCLKSFKRRITKQVEVVSDLYIDKETINRYEVLLAGLELKYDKICFVLGPSRTHSFELDNVRFYHKGEFFLRKGGETYKIKCDLSEVDYWYCLESDCSILEKNLPEVTRVVSANQSWGIMYFDGVISGVRQFKPQWSPSLEEATGYTRGLIVVKSSKGVNLNEIGQEREKNWVDTLSKQLNSVPALIPIPAYECNGSSFVRNIKRPSCQLKKTVEIIIPSKDAYGLVSVCLRSVFEMTSYPDFKVCIVDNNSSDGAVLDLYGEFLEKFPGRFRLVYYKDYFNFGKMVNLGVASSDADYTLLLNNDTKVISHNWVQDLIEYGELPGVGAVGACLLYGNGRIQHIGVDVDPHYVAGHSFHMKTIDEVDPLMRYPHEVSAVTGACLLCLREKYLEVGGFDEFNFPNGYGDVDFCLKLLDLGLRNIVVPGAKLFHYESVTRGVNIEYAERIAMRTKWRADLLDRYRSQLLDIGRNVDSHSLPPWGK